MKLFLLIALARKHGIETLQPAMQLAARTTDGMEMEILRQEVRMHGFCDANTLVEMEKVLHEKKTFDGTGVYIY